MRREESLLPQFCFVFFFNSVTMWSVPIIQYMAGGISEVRAGNRERKHGPTLSGADPFTDN